MAKYAELEEETDDCESVKAVEKQIESTINSDEVVILWEDFEILHTKIPFKSVEYAHLVNTLDRALQVFLEIEYRV